MSAGDLKRPAAAALLLALVAAGACRTGPQNSSGRQPSAATSPEHLHRVIAAVRPSHTPMEPPRPGDWLTTTEEPGQTFDQYLRSNPVRAEGARRTLYVQPLGRFTPPQRRIVELTAEFMSRFFALPVRIRPDAPLEGVPAYARRTHPFWGSRTASPTSA